MLQGKRSSIYKTASRAKEEQSGSCERQRLGSMGFLSGEGDLLHRGRNEYGALSPTPRYMGAWGPRVACHLKDPFPEHKQSPFCEYKVLEVRAQIGKQSWKLLVWVAKRIVLKSC